MLFSYVDFASIMISSVIVDVEPLCVVTFRLHAPLHGFFHTYLGGTILAVLTAVGVCFLRGWLNKILAKFNVQQKSSFVRILYTSFLGVYFHILLDSFLYGEMLPFYPLTGNPFLGVATSAAVYGLCIISFFLGLALLICKYRFSKKTRLRRRDITVLTMVILVGLVAWAPWITEEYAYNKVMEHLGWPDIPFNYLGETMPLRDVPKSSVKLPFVSLVYFPGEAVFIVTFYGSVH